MTPSGLLFSKWSLSDGNYLGLRTSIGTQQLKYDDGTQTKSDAVTEAICQAAYPDNMDDYFAPNSHTTTWLGQDNIFSPLS